VIKSVAKAMEIIKLFSPEEPRLSLAEIAARLNLPKATAHSLLATLVAYGIVERTEDGRYALGTELIPLTQAVRVNVELRDRAAPLLRELADASRESVYLTVRDGDYALYIYAIESPRRLLARTAIGERVLLHCTSVGKAILAALEPPEVEEFLTRQTTQGRLPAFTEATITRPEDLLAELETIRRQGFAIDRGEHEVGTYCVGAAIFDRQGRVLGACSISGADPEIIGARLPELSEQVMQVADEISRRMGYVPRRVSALPEPLRR